MSEFIGIMLQLCVLIIIAGACNLIAPKLKVPYTVLLFLIGLALVPVTNNESLSFLSSFTLSPDLLFYVFLPILLFESAYNMKFSEVQANRWSTRSLATVGLLISTACITAIWYGVFLLLGIDIPFEVVLLFAVIIGTTDPVAVMALFKEYGAPKRLSFIFEGESCFNDGTGLALFLVIYEIIKSGIFSGEVVLEWFIQFVLMIVWGIALGIGVWFVFSHVIERIKNNQAVEIAFTIVMAHLTFIFADLIGHYVQIGGIELKISWVIATVFAGIVMGNYGRTKISPKVEEYMEKFRGFFGFLSNSLVFILIGLIGASLAVPIKDVRLPIVILIFSVTIARAIGIYIPIGILNKLKLEEHIPTSWQHLLAWGSLRWALAFMIALLIEDSFTLPGRSFPFSIKEFITVAIIAKISYTLFFKATTIPLLIKKLKIGGNEDRDLFQKYESEIIIFSTILGKIYAMKNTYDVPSDVMHVLEKKYTNYLERAKSMMSEFLNRGDQSELIVQSLSLHAIGVEQEYLDTLFRYREIPETVYLQTIYRLNRQIERIEKWQPQIKVVKEKKNYDIFTKTNFRIDGKKDTPENKYMKYRAQYIANKKVINYLGELKKLDLVYDTKYIDEIIWRYEFFTSLGKKKSDVIYNEHKEKIDSLNAKLYEKWLLKTEEILVEDLFHKNIISNKLYGDFMEIIEHYVETWTSGRSQKTILAN